MKPIHEEQDEVKKSNIKKPFSFYKKDDGDSSEKGYLKKDSKKGDKGYKNFKSFAKKNKDGYNFEKHEGYTHSDKQEKKGDLESEPEKEYHHYEVTEKTNWDTAGGNGQKSGYSLNPRGYDSYTNHDEEGEKSETAKDDGDEKEDNHDEGDSHEDVEEEDQSDEGEDHESYEQETLNSGEDSNEEKSYETEEE